MWKSWVEDISNYIRRVGDSTPKSDPTGKRLWRGLYALFFGDGEICDPV